MVVDDSAVIRGLICRMLEQDSDVTVAASVANGQLAVSNFARHKDIDVIVLDIEMPVMDGLTALPKLLQVDPGIKVIIASTLSTRNAEISIRALNAGAADYVPKPTTSRGISGGADFRRELLEKVKTLGEIRRRRGGRAEARKVVKPGAPALPSGPIVLRQAGLDRPDILAIGSSTGGPQALFTLFKDLKKDIGLPIIITQHMPATFTAILAEHISRMSGWNCAEAKNGEGLVSGRIFLAPGDYHMTVGTKGPRRVLRLDQEAPVNYCRPAVDPMFQSVVKVFGSRVLAVVLTGMGADGLKGGRSVTQAGGTLIAQDEKTSVVWGMPGAVATAGICSAVLPIKDLAPHIKMVVGRGRK